MRRCDKGTANQFCPQRSAGEGAPNKRRHLEPAAKSSTFDEFLQTFGGHGSLHQFVEFIGEQVGRNMMELDDYLFSDLD